jgi:serine/threonine protein phosphatase PrpC
VCEALTVRWASLTHSGSRKVRNDDSHIAFASSPKGAETLPAHGSRSLENDDLVFAVSDGMGGGNAGDLASSLLLTRMAEIIPETFKIAAAGFFPDRLEYLGKAIQSVHEQINLAADNDETRGMSATLALAWFTPENLYLANVGDTRIYLSRAGTLSQLSVDHTAAWSSWKRGAISEIEYRNHPRRSALYEVVGGGHAQVCPHFAAVPCMPGDCLMICSDGLIDGLWERHIADAMGSDRPVWEMVEILAKRAIDNSGVDDTTLIVIRVT